MEWADTKFAILRNNSSISSDLPYIRQGPKEMKKTFIMCLNRVKRVPKTMICEISKEVDKT